ncbi:hypothetical protein J3R83DRAFT_2062 [Lanmaoa asiatica]|nr:hypothetical protein J3R83DRAFT_2062 [Lanmaoa asiatica]
MGNTGSSSGRPHHDDTVDYGHLSPQGVYTGPRDWNHPIVTQLIVDRKLAPFYRPLEDYNDDWDDDQILAARKDLPDFDSAISDPPAARPDPRDTPKPSPAPKRTISLKEPSRSPEAALYRCAVECPICFLYYPPNINHSRCCDQAICTECFVQIKRAEPTATHLVSEPAACPYCVQDNFGIVYTPPPWRAGIGSEGMTPPPWADPLRSQQSIPGPSNTHKRRRKSFGHDSPEVVTTDQIRPDWEAKLAAVRAAVTRRANRRIIMRQVGDRLIPVGVTSGRVHTLPTTEGADGLDGESVPPGGATGSRRRRGPRANGQTDLTQLLGQMGLGGQDLEELMVMEAMRLSLLEHEAQQRREEERARREGVTDQATTGAPVISRVDESASPRVQSGVTAPLVAYSSPQALRADDPSASTSARSRSSTPVSGQTTSSYPHGTTVDDLNDVSHSIERSIGQSTLVTETPPIGNGEAHTAHASSNDERSRSQRNTSIRGQGQQSEELAGAIRTQCTPLSSSLSDTNTPEHP